MPDGKKNKLLYNFFSLGIVQVVTSVLQLLVIPYVIAKIGVEGFGVVAVAQVVMFYLSAFTEYGFSQTATRHISLSRDHHRMVSKIFFRVIFSKLLLCFVSFLVLILLWIIVPVIRLHGLLYGVGFVFVAGQAVLINWFFQGVEKMQWMAVISLVARLLFVALVFLFIKTKDDDVLYLFFLGMGNFIMGLLSIFIVIRKFNLQFFMPTRAEIAEELREGWQITATNLANNICQYSNIFILRFFTNDLVTGYYGIAERIFLTLRQLLNVFSQSVYPQVCLLVASGKAAVMAYFRRVYIPFLLAISAGCIVLIVLAPWVLSVFIGSGNSHVTFLLRVFAIILVVACLAIPSSLILLANNRRHSYFRVYIAGAVLNISLNIVLAYFFRSTGTVIAVLFTELFILAALTRELAGFAVPAKNPGTGNLQV